MVEIKRFRSNQVYNKPVGVVRGETASAQVFNNLSKTAQRIFDMQYNEAKAQQQILGKNFAAVSVMGRDDEGNYEAVEIPANFSPVAAQQAKAGLAQSYVKQFAADVLNAGKLSYAKHKDTGNVNGFLDDWSNFTEGQLKAVSADPALRQYSGLMTQMLDNAGAGHIASLTGIQAGLANTQAYSTQLSLIDDEISQLAAASTSTNTVPVTIEDNELGVSTVDISQSLIKQEQILEHINNLREQFPQKMPPEKATALINEVYKTRYTGQISGIVGRLKAKAQAADDRRIIQGRLLPEEDYVGITLQSALAAFEAGNMDAITDKRIRAELEEAGLDNDFFNQKRMGQLKEALGDELSERQGRFVEERNAIRRIKNTEAAGVLIQNGQNISPEGQALVLESQLGISSASDLYNTVSIGNQNLMSKLQRTLSLAIQPSKVMKDAFTSTNAERFLATASMTDVMKMTSLWEQTVLSQNGTVKSRMGFDKDTVSFWNSLSFYKNSGQTMNIREFLDADQRLLTDDGKAFLNKQLIESGKAGKGSERGSFENNLREFVYNAVGKDVEMATYFMSTADKLVARHGANDAYQMIENHKDKVFVESDFIVNNERSMYAPEKFATTPKMMSDFQEGVQTAIKQSPYSKQIRFGKNVKLVPDRRGDESGYPVYTLQYTEDIRDNNNRIVRRIGDRVMGANGPIEVGFNTVIKREADRRGVVVGQFLTDAFDYRRQELLRRTTPKKTFKGANFGYSSAEETLKIREKVLGIK